MIRINLLPVKASRRQEAVRAELVLAGLVFLGLAGSLAALTARVHVEVGNMTEENDRLTKEIERLKVIVGEVDKAEKLKGDLETKLKAIQDKKKTKTGPVHMLSEIADATPDRLRLTQLTETDGVLELTGTALSNDVISQFLQNLEQSQYFENVYLKQITQVDAEDIKLKDFSLTAKVVLGDQTDAAAAKPAEAAPAAAPPPEAAPGGEG
jgi:type IV pilus assembly protein PilN